MLVLVEACGTLVGRVAGYRAIHGCMQRRGEGGEHAYGQGNGLQGQPLLHAWGGKGEVQGKMSDVPG